MQIFNVKMKSMLNTDRTIKLEYKILVLVEIIPNILIIIYVLSPTNFSIHLMFFSFKIKV